MRRCWFRTPRLCAKPSHRHQGCGWASNPAGPIRPGCGGGRCRRWCAWTNARESIVPDGPRPRSQSAAQSLPALRLPRIRARDTRQALTEDLAWARRIAAAETADSSPQLDRNTLPWQVVQPAEIATMSTLAEHRQARQHWRHGTTTKRGRGRAGCPVVHGKRIIEAGVLPADRAFVGNSGHANCRRRSR